MNGRQYLLAVNGLLVEKHFPHFNYHGYDDPPYFEGWQESSSGRYRFLFRLCLPLGSPDVPPELFLWDPITVPDYSGCSLNSVGVSHAYHLLSNGEGGRLQICHTKPDVWDCSCTFVHVLFKAAIWLEAYSWHRDTGDTIHDFLKARSIDW